jgi:hypothetical protein
LLLAACDARIAWFIQLCGCALQLAAAADETAQPWRCLCRGSEQITMTRPWRRMTLHLLQIFLTLGLTFTANFSSRPAGRAY